jgi:hypothetical protein
MMFARHTICSNTSTASTTLPTTNNETQEEFTYVNDVTELMALFVSQYQTKQFKQDGAQEQSVPAPLDQLDVEIQADAAKLWPDADEFRKKQVQQRQLVARKAIEHFVAFCRQFLQEHPPETHIMLAQGFGVRLTGGYDVSLTPPLYNNLGGTMEMAPAVPVTVGLGNPGMRGVEPSHSFAVTGAQPHPGLRGPGA